MMKKNPLAVAVGKLVLDNPVMVASGTFGYGEEFCEYCDVSRLGAIVSKTITCRPRTGNPPPRTCETPAGMLNSIGLENPGIDVFLREKLPVLAQWGVPVIVSIASEGDQKEFVRLAEALDTRKEVAAIELNISCPNVTNSKMRLAHRLVAQDPRATRAVVKAVRKVTQKTIITKLSPNVTDIVEIAQAAEDAGSDAIALINTLMGLSIDIEKRKAKVAMGIAGLSGPAVRPVSVRMVHSVYQHVRIPLIGMGGIVDAASALEFIIAGATAVSVGTANFIHPAVGQGIVGGLKEYLRKHKIKDVKHLIGSFVL